MNCPTCPFCKRQTTDYIAADQQTKYCLKLPSDIITRLLTLRKNGLDILMKKTVYPREFVPADPSDTFISYDIATIIGEKYIENLIVQNFCKPTFKPHLTLDEAKPLLDDAKLLSNWKIPFRIAAEPNEFYLISITPHRIFDRFIFQRVMREEYYSFYTPEEKNTMKAMNIVLSHSQQITTYKYLSDDSILDRTIENISIREMCPHSLIYL
jgi:hypothetical protein